MYYTGTPFRTQRTPLPSLYSSSVTLPTNDQSGTIATPKRKRSKTIQAPNMLTSTTKRRQLSNRPPPLSRVSTNTIPETIIIESSDEGSRHTGQGKGKRTFRMSLPGEDHETTGSGNGVLKNPAVSGHEALANGPSAGRRGNAGQDVLEGQSAEDYVLQRPLRRPFNPISLDLLPRWNPFIRATLPDDSEEEEIIFQADDIVERDTPRLVTARESGFFDTSIETGHEDAAVRFAAAAVYFRWHVIEETDV